MIRSVIPFLCVALASCGGREATAPALAPNRDSERAPGPIALSVAVTAREVRPGVPVTIRVSATNTSGAPLTLHFSSGCQILPYVRNAAGQVVLPEGGQWGCTQALTELHFRPGETKEQTYRWAGSTSFVSEMPQRLLPPGEYEVFAALRARELVATSPGVRVRLLPPG